MKTYKVLDDAGYMIAEKLDRADAEWIKAKACNHLQVHPMETSMPYDEAPVTLKFETLTPSATHPSRQTRLAAGFDLCADLTNKPLLNSKGTYILLPSCTALIPTGIKATIKEGFEGQIRSRSGLSLKHGVVVLNGVGTVDADYEGEIKVLLINHGMTSFEIKQGTRIAQLVIAPVFTGSACLLIGEDASKYTLEQENNASKHTRDNKGFGSTGEE